MESGFVTFEFLLSFFESLLQFLKLLFLGGQEGLFAAKFPVGFSILLELEGGILISNFSFNLLQLIQILLYFGAHLAEVFVLFLLAQFQAQLHLIVLFKLLNLVVFELQLLLQLLLMHLVEFLNLLFS